jgi:glycosyltransferase involved in cell wall biosynthesis
MRIALVKPDWRIRGGFEVVVDGIERELQAAGHEVDRVGVDVLGLPRTPFGVSVDDRVWSHSPGWFTHLAMLDCFRALDVTRADLVLSTQPPSYAVRHPRHLSLFYHHARAFYDLSDLWVEAGRAPRVLHETSAAMLRDAEAQDLAGVTHFLAGSTRIVERLRQYQGADVPVSLYQYPAPTVPDLDTTTYDDVLTVSRHEFTKRTELVVQALALGDRCGVLVGDGGRLPFVRALATRIAVHACDPADLTARDLWLNMGVHEGSEPTVEHERIRIAGWVADEELDRLYRTALCVVAPAYDEDDGLTVLEAMAHGRPVNVCRDGGGLTSLVEDGVNGFVVEPDGAGIAAAIARLAADPGLARIMGLAALETVRPCTAARARQQLLDAVDRVAGGGPR